MMNFQEEEGEDLFDRLPDALLHLIFDKVRDAKTLSRCVCVSKRFASAVPEIDSVSLAIARKSPNLAAKKFRETAAGGGARNYWKSLIHRVVKGPLQFVLRVISKKSSPSAADEEDGCEFPYYSPNEVLRNFKEIRSLEIELPGYGGQIGSDRNDSLLKWRAEFGSELESCVILGAKSFHRRSRKPKSSGEDEDRRHSPPQSQPDLLLADEELKLRVVWTISCLIAASARHYLLQQVVSGHDRLVRAVVGDSSRQGRLCMKEGQIEEMRRSLTNPPPSDAAVLAPERTRIPALKMMLWYVPELELPVEGSVMEGATLVIIRPVDGGEKKAESDSDLVARVIEEEAAKEGEDRVFGEAAKEMMKMKRTYTLEMNSF